MTTLRTRYLLIIIFSVFLLALLISVLFLSIALFRSNKSLSSTPTTSRDSCSTIPVSQARCFTPHQYRLAYGIDSLVQRGLSGKGQTVIDIVSFGSPSLQQDIDVFDTQFGLPPIKLQIEAPIGTMTLAGTPTPTDKDLSGWADETALDVEIIHATAPDARIVVLTSPVNEVEGTTGLPEFLQLEKYAAAHYPGSIVSQSWGASEATLKDQAGQQEIQQWDAFYQQSSKQQKMTYLSASGDTGATDYADLQATQLASTPTTSFPSDDPWVIGVGGTALVYQAASYRASQRYQDYQETAWRESGGGFSTFFKEPDFQKTLPASVQGQSQHRRGVPDVAGVADPNSGLTIYSRGAWNNAGGTSASTPLWGALIAIANQMAGHPLGYVNTKLYKVATSDKYTQDFRDITSGNNDVNQSGVQFAGYPAVQGWDPVTGLGAPIAEKLLPDLIKSV